MNGTTKARPFPERVRLGFARRADMYERQARLQRAVAWRLARHCRDLPLPPGPCADLGAGTGLLSRALRAQRPQLVPWRLDACAPLLEHQSPETGPGLVWDLNGELPEQLEAAALLVSSFSLQWLEGPEHRLAHWCRRLAPGGWLALTVPTAASFPQWRQAAIRAGVPCTALALPGASALLTAASAAGLEPRRVQRLCFTETAPRALTFLRRIQAIGAGTSPLPPLAPGQWRRLEAHWPLEPACRAGGHPSGKRFSWEVLLLMGRRPDA